MTNNDAVVEIQKRILDQITRYTSLENEVDKAQIFGRASGLILSLKFLMEDKDYKAVGGMYARLLLGRAEQEGTILKDGE